MLKPIAFFLIFISICNLLMGQPFSKNDYNKDNNSLLWEISGKDIKQPSYLFGTFHLMCKEDIRFSENLFRALKYSSSLYLEIDLDDPANTFSALKYMYMKDGVTLSKLLDSLHYKKIKNFFSDSLHMSMTMIEKMKPTFSSSLVYPFMMTCKSTDGIEMELIKISKAQQKETYGFETIEFQSSIFDNIPYHEQVAELYNMIDSIDVYKLNFIKMLSLYKSQRLDEIEKSFDDEQGFEEHKDVMLTNRNKNWLSQLKIILPKSNIFIAVGAGHLAGDNGLIQLLKNEGYTLKPLYHK
jgi:uncharacterized protein YbaP (TraB family)